MKRLRRSLRGQWSDHSKLMGLFFGLAALCLLLPGIFSPNRLGTVDNGRYESTMLSAGLEYLDADAEEADTLFYHHVIERYGYGSFSYWKLLAPNGENSIVYPIALIRVVTAPFGLDFSTQYLALFYALLFALGVYMLVRATGCVGGWLAAIPGFLLLLAAGSRNLTVFQFSLSHRNGDSVACADAGNGYAAVYLRTKAGLAQFGGISCSGGVLPEFLGDLAHICPLRADRNGGCVCYGVR